MKGPCVEAIDDSFQTSDAPPYAAVYVDETYPDIDEMLLPVSETQLCTLGEKKRDPFVDKCSRSYFECQLNPQTGQHDWEKVICPEETVFDFQKGHCTEYCHHVLRPTTTTPAPSTSTGIAVIIISIFIFMVNT